MSVPPVPGAPVAPPGPPGEGSLIGRFVAIITPFFALAAGWIAGVLAHNVPGVKLDKGEIVAFMVAVATSALTAGWKYVEGFQKHEQRVADGIATPIKIPSPPT